MSKAEFDSGWEACRCCDYDAARQVAAREVNGDSVVSQMRGHATLAVCDTFQNEVVRGVGHFREALFLSETCGHIWDSRLELVHGLLQRELGEHNLAVDIFEGIYRGVLRHADPLETFYAAFVLGMGFFRMSRFPEAIEVWDAAEGYLGDGAHPVKVAHLRAMKGAVNLYRTEWQEAERCFDEAEELFTALDVEDQLAYTRAGRAAAWAKQGDPQRAIGPLQRAVRYAEARLHSRLESLWLLHLAEAYVQVGQEELALESYVVCSQRAVESRLFGRGRASYHAVLKYLEARGERDRLLDYHRKYLEVEKTIQATQKADRENSLNLLQAVREWRAQRDSRLK